MSERIYLIDWNKLGRLLLPVKVRQKKVLALVKALITPVNIIHTQFVYFRSNVKYRLGITPQVCHLERGLNDRYDLTERRIRIIDGIEMSARPLFLKVENKFIAVGKKVEGSGIVLFTKSETAQFITDFVIQIPGVIPFDVNEVSAFVNGYKLTSKTFKIQTI